MMHYRDKQTPVGNLFVFPPSYYLDEDTSNYTEICETIGERVYKLVAVACGDTDEESSALAVRIARFLQEDERKG